MSKLPKRVEDGVGVDMNVARVSEMLYNRMEKGYTKYGVTTERKDLNTIEWLQHLQEELLDGAVYIERLKNEFKNSSK